MELGKQTIDDNRNDTIRDPVRSKVEKRELSEDEVLVVKKFL